MRAKGYKCNNVKCDRCVGHSMCGELGDIALNCIDRIITRQTNAQKIRGMSDEELAAFLDMCESVGYEDSSIATDSGGHCMDMLEWLKQQAE